VTIHLDAGRLSSALAGRYQVQRKLGEGGMATVWLAVDLKHQRRVAIKVLKPELAAVVGSERFLAEIRTTANLEHPHILPLFDSGEDDGLLWYAMPYIEGESLRERLDREGPLPVDTALEIAAKVAGALQEAHERGIVHRDVKPPNILLDRHDEPRVADFGVALALSEARSERMTATGLSVGTPSYMSPEQHTGDREVDARSDVYALGVLLFEMLAGHPPFQGDTVRAVVTRTLTEEAPPLGGVRPDVPPGVARAVAQALAKDPGARTGSAEAFRAALVPASASGPRRSVGFRMAAWLAAAAVGVGAVLGWRTLQVSQARASLTEVAALADQGRYVEAFSRVLAAERWIPGDSTLAALGRRVSMTLSVTTDPAGAEMEVQRFDQEAQGPPESVPVGTTPMDAIRLPRADHRMVLRLPGFVSRELVVSSELVADSVSITGSDRVTVVVQLSPEADTPEGMIPVPGGAYGLTSPDAPSPETVVELEPFFIHRFEVTNEAYARFVAAGGYGRHDLWDHAPAEVRGTLVDRTGLPGPREWTRQRFPEGEEMLPVTGVTWWEAQAFCRSVGGRLPTVFEWEKTARAGLRSHFGVIMPWGLESAVTGGGQRANFDSDGPMPVDRHPFGVSFFGAYAMAGNVREWTLNAFGQGRAVTGGSWQGPAYLFPQYDDVPAESASQSIGFRCARHDGTGDQGGSGIELDLTPPVYAPVDRATFESLLEFYRYDSLPANPRIVAEEDTPDWTRSRIWIDGPESDSILLYFWMPKSSRPPYQTLVYVPGNSVFFYERVPDRVEDRIGPLIQGGRAALAVVMQGMLERGWPPGYAPPAPPTVGFRDLMVQHATELRLAMDYIQGREDVDPDGLAYVGDSWGAGSRLAFAVVDRRYRAAILLGAGIDERVKPTLPEADNVNFAPYIDVPTLMINGTNDEEHPWLYRAKPLWDLLSEPRDLLLVEGAGHIPPLESRIPAMRALLDSVLGPVRR